MEGVNTASLRSAAAHWSLAGDQQLLGILENLHERIITKCQAANAGLEGMVAALDSASLSLQNVNNRFMALNNSQFVESRVYDDDIDVATQEPAKETPTTASEPVSELASLKESLATLQAFHEPLTILDSDSDSGEDDEEGQDRLVLKPKDLYADRPLPHIIGSHQWRTKWHAGLVREDSDTDSSASRAGGRSPADQYSDSEREDWLAWADKQPPSQRTISTNSSIGSELTVPTAGKPADIAAELARRLGGAAPRVPTPEPDIQPSTSTPTKVYRPQQPTTAMIFPDEPPPLDAASHSDREDWDSEDECGTTPRNIGAKQSSPLFEDAQDSELFTEPPQSKPHTSAADRQTETSKKPVGGISVVGDNRGAESIGAAILKRHVKKDSGSEEENGNKHAADVKVNVHSERNKSKQEDSGDSKDKTQKDILNDLFSKPNTKKQNKNVLKDRVKKEDAPVVKKVDLFADDLFDDIDDIFTNVKPLVKKAKQKENVNRSLFDDDDQDNLFVNIPVSSNKSSSKPEIKGKSIFDSDDELFSENYEDKNADKISNISTPAEIPKDISNIGSKTERTELIKTTKGTQMNDSIPKNSSTVSKGEMSKNVNISRIKTTSEEKSSAQGSKAKSIFDSDSDDDIFADFKSTDKFSTILADSQTKTNKFTVEKSKSRAIGDFENDDSLFLPKNIPIHRKNEPINIESSKQKDNEIKNKKYIAQFVDDDDDDDDTLFRQTKNHTTAKISITPEFKNDSTTNKVQINDFEQDTLIHKKSGQLLSTESIEDSPKMKSNSNLESDDELFSNNINQNKNIQNKEESSILGNTKTQLRSPSLFNDEDEDELFTNPTSISTIINSEEISDKLGNKITDKIITGSQFVREDESHEDILKANSAPNNQAVANVTCKEDELIDSINVNKTMEPNEICSQGTSYKKMSEDLEVSESLSQNKINKDTEDSEFNLQNSQMPLPVDDDFADDTIPKNTLLEKNVENIKTEYDNNKIGFTQNGSLFSEPKESISDEPDIFNDIFSDVPPEFERPKEPKKSKNVNALFDDDSDDESLFFKKNEIITDEKPDVSFSSQEDRLFHIFHDEPPSIDVDFTQKHTKSLSSHLETSLRNTDSEKTSKIFEKRIDLEHTATSHEPKEDNTAIADPVSENAENEMTKPVGKLKPVNININVSTLLPGASPKKTKPNEEIDGQIISTKSDLTAKDDDLKIVKSVSFEGDPDSEVLDNKFSKERAKIQVKRRPSTRKARKEAVRKSRIDFGEDSTDNSSATDLSKQDDFSTVESHTLAVNTNKNSRSNPTGLGESKPGDINAVNTTTTVPSKQVPQLNSYISKNNVDTNVSMNDANLEKQVDVENDITNKIEDHTVERQTNSNNLGSGVVSNDSNKISDLTNAFNKRSSVKSKVVYILNDEDIFTDTKTVTTQNVTQKKQLNIIDDDEIFKPSFSEHSNVGALGNVNLKDKTIDNFDSDEDIFKASQSKIKTKSLDTKTGEIPNKSQIDHMEAKIDQLFVKTQSSKVKSSFLDDLSDDEMELFGSRKDAKIADILDSKSSKPQDVQNKVALPRADAKGALFGDDIGDDDDDLFRVKTVKNKEPIPTRPVTKVKEAAPRTTEPVFEDPLSAFCREDDT